jgi:hypothetical protein
MIDKNSFIPLFQWFSEFKVAKAIAESTYAFAIIEVFHLFGIVLLLGGATVMSLRLLNLMWRDRPVSMVARELGWFTFIGLMAMLISGVLMFASNTQKYFASIPFWWKMLFFWGGVAFHFTMYRKVTRSDNTGLILGGLTAVLALTLWYGTGILGRAIGFY